MFMLKAAIIDDGIDASQFKNVKSWVIKKDLSIENENLISVKDNHACTCLKIIQKYCDMSDVFWHSIKILNDDTKRGNIRQFIEALRLCEQLEVKIIHLSIGTRSYSDFNLIEKSIEALCDKGTIIIAAACNEGTVAYPACMNGVIGVKCDFSATDQQYLYNCNTLDNISFSASARHILRDRGKLRLSLQSNSYAAPLITSKALSLLTQRPYASFEEVYLYLVRNAYNYSESMHVVYFNPRSCAERILLNIICENTDNRYSMQKLKLKCSQYNIHSKSFLNELDSLDLSVYNEIIVSFSCAEAEEKNILTYLLYRYKSKIIVYHNNSEFEYIPSEKKDLDRLWIYKDKLTCGTYFNCGQEITIPIIGVFYRNLIELTELVDKIKSGFVSDGYHCEVFADFSQAELIGLNVIPENNIKEYIYECICFYDCDVAVVGFRDIDKMKKLNDFDVIVYPQDGNWVLIDENSFIADNGSKTDDVYKKIKSIIE